MTYPGRDPIPRRVIVEDCVDLPHVPPGETYATTCRPHEPILFSEFLVRDFCLVQLVVGALGMATKERAAAIGMRAYQLERQMLVTSAMDISIVLRNETDRPLPVRQAAFESAQPTTWTTSREPVEVALVVHESLHDVLRKDGDR